MLNLRFLKIALRKLGLHIFHHAHGCAHTWGAGAFFLAEFFELCLLNLHPILLNAPILLQLIHMHPLHRVQNYTVEVLPGHLDFRCLLLHLSFYGISHKFLRVKRTGHRPLRILRRVLRRWLATLDHGALRAESLASGGRLLAILDHYHRILMILLRRYYKPLHRLPPFIILDHAASLVQLARID